MPVPPPLLFDLDGTLVDSARTIATALSVVVRDRGGDPVVAETVRPLVSKGVGVLVSTVLGDLAGEPDADVAAFRAILRTLPADPADLYPGAVAALQALHAAGHPMAIVTNKPEGLARSLLDSLELTGFFGAIIGGDTCPACKPQAEPLHTALAAIAPQCRTCDAIMIGDSDIDGLAAQAASCRFVLFTGGYGPLTPERYPISSQFSSFHQMDEQLIALAGAACTKAG